ncbi:MAG: sodium:solute symporter family protein [Myxococcales bacterium]|nr:sodium:solute symporter family protein [Myxococcales bacterium]
MGELLAPAVVFGYLGVAAVIGILAGRRSAGGATDFVAGERAFGPLVMYFVMGATVFSAYALLGTPQRVIAKGSDAFYILAYGAVGFAPLFFFGARVRRIGAREGFVTQAELIGARFGSRRVTALMGAATLVAFLPYMVIQLKGAGIVMEAVMGWPPLVGAAVVYAVVTGYVIVGGMRGVGWTNVVQGAAMLVVVWVLGLTIPERLFGGVEAMFDRVVAERPEWLVLPGPASAPTTPFQYSSEVLVSILGFSMWPQVFMKCFTARSARLVQLTAVVYPTFLLFLVPLLLLGYAALLLPGAPTDENVLLWLVSRPELGGAEGLTFAFVSFAILAASMSTGDALLHGGGSILVRDVLVGGLGWDLDERAQTRWMRGTILALGVIGLALLAVADRISVVDLLLLAYAIPIQFLPPVLAGLYWRRANRRAGEWGLGLGLAAVVVLFAASLAAPGLYAALNPLGLQIGVIGVVINTAAIVLLSLLTPPMARSHLDRFEVP